MGFCAPCYQRDRRARIASGAHVPIKPKERRCKVMGCESAHSSKGFCRKHYLRTRKEREAEIKRNSAQKTREASERSKSRKVRHRPCVQGRKTAD